MSFKLLKSLRNYKKFAIITIVASIFDIIFKMLIPYKMAVVIDEGINKSNMDILVKVGIEVIIYALLGTFFIIILTFSAGTAASGYSKNLRNDLFKKLGEMSFGNIDEVSRSSLLTRIISDVNKVQNSFYFIIKAGVRNIFTIVFAIFMTLSINKSMGIIFLFMAPFFAIIFIILMKVIDPKFKALVTYSDVINEGIVENVNNQRVIKSFSGEEFEIDKFHKKNSKFYNISLKAMRVMALINPVLSFGIYIMITVILGFSGKAILYNGMSIGALLTIIAYSVELIIAVFMLGFIFVSYAMSRPSIARIKGVMDIEVDIVNCENPIKEVKNGDVEFKNVSFSYSKNSNGISNISFKINSGETIGIMGATGSAKSTLISLIPRLYDVCKGEVLVGGINVKCYDLKALRDEVSVVLQNNKLFSGTIAENLRWGNKEASDEEIKSVCKIACADEFIERFSDGYETKLNVDATNLSGGQKQRLCIARALLKKPKIMIFDDSTSAVDTKTEARIQEAFSNQLKGMTKIIIAQRISSVKNADKILIMDDGKLIDYASPKILLDRCSIYREIYDSQLGGIDE